MDREWIRQRNFTSLSIKDLLEAREAYHVHLAHLENVIGTAIGRYLILHDDPNFKDPNTRRAGSGGRRTLRNASARKWSWPCILVFVSQWKDRKAFAAHPDSMVPRFLYLPDGRVIPTCVVDAERDQAPRLPALPPAFPNDLVGGGFPALAEVQGRRHLSSLGCLVTDGDSVYALTNRHVTGERGREIYTIVGGRRHRLGQSAGREVGKKAFPEVYPGWPGSRVLANLDAGLIRIDDVSDWTAQVYGVGELGPVWDLNVDTFTLDLIGCGVRANGAASGPLLGQIQALFYRYKTVGGVDYVTDFLIGPRGDEVIGTKPGDSGTIWFEDRPENEDASKEKGHRAERLRPFALQWGGEPLLSPGSDRASDFVLATALSTVSRELDVDLIANWNTGQPETWGAVGHFKVGALACELLKTTWLRDLFMLNQQSIGYEDQTLVDGVPSHSEGDFVPLADVADFVWRDIRKIDDNNHFADIDEKAEQGTFKGKTLLSLTKNRPENVDPDVWNAFYESIGASKRGALPFRVWQIFDEMVDFAAGRKIREFFCAGGLMAHYVGDACQPLHASKFHHGREASESKVHEVYETSMLNRFADELIAAISAARTDFPVMPAIKGNGHDVGVAVVELMRRSAKRLPPLRIIEVFASQPGGRARTEAMWNALGKKTAVLILDGATTLAGIWDRAWKLGRGGGGNPALPARAFSQRSLQDLYVKDSFLKSSKLQQLTRAGDKIVPI